MNLRVIFAGTPTFAAVALQTLLHSSHAIIAVYTQPDRPAGRGRRLQFSPVKELALQHHIPVFQPERLKDLSVHHKLLALKPDLLIVAAYGLLLPRALLDIPTYGCINIHASLLPRWRGAAPIQHAILAGDTKTGISIMQMTEGLDTGDILLKRECAITPMDTNQSLQNKLALLGAEALLETLQKLITNTLQPKKQDDAQATYAHKIIKTDAKLDWNDSAVFLDRKIRAYNPWPVAFTEMKGTNIRVWAASPISTETHGSIQIKPGTIVNINKDSLDITTGDGILRLLELQLPGGKRLSIQNILHANKFFEIGAVFT